MFDDEECFDNKKEEYSENLDEEFKEIFDDNKTRLEEPAAHC